MEDMAFLHFWPETEEMIRECGLHQVRVDQGRLGHPTKKPTRLLTDVDEIKVVDGWRLAGRGQAWPETLSERIEYSKALATWAPGLKELLCHAVKRLAKVQGAMVKSLTTKEKREIVDWQEHYRADHLPFRKDCEVCLRGAGTDRQRRRLACPTSYCLSMDIMGPFEPGHDQEGEGVGYGLVGVYTVPVDKHNKPMPKGLSELYLPHQQKPDPEDEQDGEGLQDGKQEKEEPLPERDQDVRKRRPNNKKPVNRSGRSTCRSARRKL